MAYSLNYSVSADRPPRTPLPSSTPRGLRLTLQQCLVLMLLTHAARQTMTGRRRYAHGRGRAAASAALALEWHQPTHRAVPTRCVSRRGGIWLLRSELLVLQPPASPPAPPARAAPPAPARCAPGAERCIARVPRRHGRERGGVPESPLGRAAAVRRRGRQRGTAAPRAES